MRLVSVVLSSYIGDLTILTMKFGDDFPLNGYKYSSPVSNLSSDGGYAIDSRPISDYGVRVLQGKIYVIRLV